MKNQLIKAIVLGTFSLGCAITQGANIAWVSFHPADDTPSPEAAAAGFSKAPDVGYTDLLKTHGHTVTRIVTSGAPDVASLNAFDLVIISRSVPSGDYATPLSTAAWNSIIAPTLIVNGYVLRNSRLGFVAGANLPDTAGRVRLSVKAPSHPIFEGVALGSDHVTVNAYADLVTYNGTLQRGLSANTDPLAGDGTLLASISRDGDPAHDALAIAEWAAGAQMANGAADKLGGPRLVLLTGSREQEGVSAHGAGIYDLADDGARLFLNAVAYMTYCSPHAARATATIVNGFVVGVTLTDYGCGYTEAPLVLFQGGSGSGAAGTAVLLNGKVVAINVVSPGSGYTSEPRVTIASPPFVPWVSVAVSKVNVTQHVVLGRNYILESSVDLVTWIATGAQFTADSETIVTEFAVDTTGRFFRLREVP